ncbi:hypothetical protein MNBD_BACTEROID01-1566 [hydrothermal vent metagenome]|uniref:PLD phosphodiesterase domain-containing protein n=1 Tax=hydrothermal vent metagenome TaxID=652676 RepID=A0A3B0TQG8_9ZZZZ
MRKAHLLFDGPEGYTENNRYPYTGASPKFVGFLKEYLLKYSDVISFISIAIYLFNNFELHKLFRELAEKGVQINVVSIPLEGYDHSSPQAITHSGGSLALNNKHTKYSLASIIYQDFMEKPLENYHLYLFPHTYIRSPRIKPFSRGKMPYSLHTKSFFIEFKNGDMVSGLTSSNLAMRDLVKHDTFLLREVATGEGKSTKAFFSHLASASVPINDFRQNKTDAFNYPIRQQVCPATGESHFVAPFYINSAEKAEQIIIDLMQTAQQRICVMAQHISAFDYSVPLNFKTGGQTGVRVKRKGMLHTLLEKGKQGVEVVCISQTYVCSPGKGQDFRKPANQSNFINFIREFRKLPNPKYFVNDAIHSKYIIVDDKVVVTTFNYTPTQFISLPYVKIDKFEHIEGLAYKGVFSEVGQLIQLSSKQDVACFKRNFLYVQQSKGTVRVI